MKYAWFITDSQKTNFYKVSDWVDGKVAAKKLKDEIVEEINKTCRLELHAQADAGELRVSITFVPDNPDSKTSDAPPPIESLAPPAEPDHEELEPLPEPTAAELKNGTVSHKNGIVTVTINGARLLREFDDEMKAARAVAGIRTVMAKGELPQSLELFVRA